MRILQFGSNMDQERLEKRVGDVKVVGTHVLEGWRLVFDLLRENGTGAADIARGGTDDVVIGRVYELTEDQVKKLDKIEVMYRRATIDGLELYLGRGYHRTDHVDPRIDYFNYILKGLKQMDVNKDYIDDVVSKAYGGLYAKKVFGKPRDYPDNAIALGKKARQILDVEVGDYVEAIYGTKVKKLRVHQLKNELLVLEGEDVVQIGEKARERLGIKEIGQRTREKYRTLYDSFSIRPCR